MHKDGRSRGLSKKNISVDQTLSLVFCFFVFVFSGFLLGFLLGFSGFFRVSGFLFSGFFRVFVLFKILFFSGLHNVS